MVDVAIVALPKTAVPGHLPAHWVYVQVLPESVCTMKSFLLISHQKCISGTSQVLCAKCCVEG